MMKRVCLLVLSLALVFLSLPGLAESAAKTPLEGTAEMLTFAHYAMLSRLTMETGRYKTEEEFFNEMALLELTGHSYGNPAYRSHDNIWDAVFQPDSSGQKVARVQLVADVSVLESDTRNGTAAMYHVFGLCSPCWMMDTGLKDIVQDFAEIYAEALVSPANKHTREISFNGVKISCYRNGQTLGIIIEYPEPVDESMVINNPLASAALNAWVNQ